MGRSARWSVPVVAALCACCSIPWASRAEEVGDRPAPVECLRQPKPTLAAATQELGWPMRTFLRDRIAMWQLDDGDGRCVVVDDKHAEGGLTYLLVVEYGLDDSILRWSLIERR